LPFVPPPDEVAEVPVEEFADVSAVDDCEAWAGLWSPAAMNPTSAPPTATLTPAARSRPCVLSERRAMPGIVAGKRKGFLRIA
jgi:hypothetical protein